MQNSIVAVYDDYSQAQSAYQELMAKGFDRSMVQMSPEQQTQESRTASLTRKDEDEGWSIGKFFRSMFGEDEDATTHGDVYHEAVRRGSTMLTVQASSDEQRDRACEIMNRFNPVDIDDRSSKWRSAGWSGYDRSSAAFTDDEATRERALYAKSGTQPGGLNETRATAGGASGNIGKTGETRLPVMQEELQVGKRAVQRGGVRIYQHVTDTPVEETVRLRDEKVNVKRRPVNKPATEADLAAFKEGSMELRETAEEPVVSKQARVVEEVVVSKDVRERDQTVRDNVRRTDVDVEQLGGGGRTSAAGFDDTYYRNHWQTSFAKQGGRYEDYEPAYRFGNELQGNAGYKSRSWNEIEPEVRRDWESRYSSSPWERSKDAVKHAWERTGR